MLYFIYFLPFMVNKDYHMPYFRRFIGVWRSVTVETDRRGATVQISFYRAMLRRARLRSKSITPVSP